MLKRLIGYFGSKTWVLGASMLLGGLRNGTQRFDSKVASLDSTLLFMAVVLFKPEGIAGLAQDWMKRWRR